MQGWGSHACGHPDNLTRVHLKRQRDEATCGKKKWAGTEGRSGTPAAMLPLQEGKERCRELERPLRKVSIRAPAGESL